MIAVIRLTPRGYHSIVPAAGAFVVVAFVAVLCAVELLRAFGTPRADAWRRRMEIAAVPLVLATVFVVAARLAPLVG